jgi:hypothetical protein
MVCNTEGTPERIVINVSELEQQEEVAGTSSKNARTMPHKKEESAARWA